METILYLAHTEIDGTLCKAALETLSAAVTLTQNLQDATLTIGLIGADIKNAADSIADAPAQSFIGIEGADFSAPRYCSDAVAVEKLGKTANATLIIAPGTSRFSRSVPGAVFRLNGRTDTHTTAFDVSGDSLKIQRWYYRQRMLATLSRTQRPWGLLIDSGVFPIWEGSGGTAELEIIDAQLSDGNKRTEVVGIEAPSTDTETIRPDAETLFVAGAGWMKKQADGSSHVKEAEKIILEFLNHTQASLGSSKSLVDQTGEGVEVISFLSHLNQIGQTGTTPRHQKGLATCCHGEEPHTIGWRFIQERRAINTDPNCGWAQGKADVVYVADAFEVMQKVNELLDS
jgi:electron transfer flavoprotein alpha subunit